MAPGALILLLMTLSHGVVANSQRHLLSSMFPVDLLFGTKIGPGAREASLHLQSFYLYASRIDYARKEEPPRDADNCSLAVHQSTRDLAGRFLDAMGGRVNRTFDAVHKVLRAVEQDEFDDKLMNAIGAWRKCDATSTEPDEAEEACDKAQRAVITLLSTTVKEEPEERKDAALRVFPLHRKLWKAAKTRNNVHVMRFRPAKTAIKELLPLIIKQQELENSRKLVEEPANCTSDDLDIDRAWRDNLVPMLFQSASAIDNSTELVFAHTALIDDMLKLLAAWLDCIELHGSGSSRCANATKEARDAQREYRRLAAPDRAHDLLYGLPLEVDPLAAVASHLALLGHRIARGKAAMARVVNNLNEAGGMIRENLMPVSKYLYQTTKADRKCAVVFGDPSKTYHAEITIPQVKTKQRRSAAATAARGAPSQIERLKKAVADGNKISAYLEKEGPLIASIASLVNCTGHGGKCNRREMDARATALERTIEKSAADSASGRKRAERTPEVRDAHKTMRNWWAYKEYEDKHVDSDYWNNPFAIAAVGVLDEMADMTKNSLVLSTYQNVEKVWSYEEPSCASVLEKWKEAARVYSVAELDKFDRLMGEARASFIEADELYEQDRASMELLAELGGCAKDKKRPVAECDQIAKELEELLLEPFYKD